MNCIKLLALLVLAVMVSGCGCTDSYFKSFVTFGVGYKYCMKVWGEKTCSRCFTPTGHNPDCGCSKDCPCWTAGQKDSKEKKQ